MSNYDWIVVGAGITGSALSYELAKQKHKVLLLEKDRHLNNATVCSYGGLAYWCGTTDLNSKLCQESLEIHKNLSEELNINTELRDIDLLLTINKKTEPKKVLANVKDFHIQPQLLNVKETCELEPLLNRNAINGALRFPHGHVHPEKITLGYQQSFQKLGGEIKIEKAIKFLKKGEKIEGIKTNKNSFYGKNVVICAGGLTRKLLQENGVQIPIFFTHAQLIKTVPTDIKLRTLVMSANLERLVMEKDATKPERYQLWENPNDDVLTDIIEAGGVQFVDGTICMGQISQIITNPHAQIDPKLGEAEIRQKVEAILPSISNLKGSWHNCLVSFSDENDFTVGKLDGFDGLYLFSGFTSPFVYVPPLARHFANYFSGQDDQVMSEYLLK